MSVFDSRYYTDEEIWARVERFEKERHLVQLELARPDISTDPEIMPELARRLNELEQFVQAAEELRGCLNELRILDEMLAEEDHSADDRAELEALHEEYAGLGAQKAAGMVKLLLDRGCLEQEVEDQADLDILKFIDYAGPEYAWRLGINVGLDVAETRRRLDVLLAKGFLARVEGNMLENYHRAKSWTKHMNHTYYRITRAGRHYLRLLRSGADEQT